MANTAEFIKSKKEGRMGLKISYCKFFVREIKSRISDYRFEDKAKAWFFNASDYQTVRDLIIESFPSEGITITEIDGTSEHIWGSKESRNHSEWATDGERFAALNQD